MKTLLVNVFSDDGLRDTLKAGRRINCTPLAFKKDWVCSLAHAKKKFLCTWCYSDVKKQMKVLGWTFDKPKKEKTVEVFY